MSISDMEEKKNSEIRKLVLAKSIYLHGCTHASRKDHVSKMIAIHHFDNAVEMALRCVVIKQGIMSGKKTLYFEDYLSEIDKLPLKEQMRNLHRLRNNIQHGGDIPSMESVIKYEGYAEDFFRNVCNDIFGVPYDELFLSELIKNDNLRKQVREAEESFGIEEFKRCIELCDDALISATFEGADLFHAAGVLTGYWGASNELKMVLSKDYPEKYRKGDFYEFARELRGAILQWGQAATSMQFLDEYRMDFLKHRQIIETLEDISDEELRNNAKFTLNFVINLIFKWEGEGLFD